MIRSNVTNSLAAAALSFFATYAGMAQEVKNLPADATAHFIYFPTGGYKLDAKDEEQIRDVAGMIQSHPDFVATILGKTDSVGSVGFNERLSQRRANAVFEALVYDHKVSENRISVVLDRRAPAIHINCRSNRRGAEQDGGDCREQGAGCPFLWRMSLTRRCSSTPPSPLSMGSLPTRLAKLRH